ncbi:MAG: hypothetical protein HZA78_09855 [Candidatus Schekmanbacteria bacterium]|nr:hypothetical protein [Candidatus Schekmanbacteria bacterium]
MKGDQRNFLSDKLGDLGNFAVGALTFGQFLSQKPFAFGAFAFGIIFWATCYVLGYVILKGGE